MSHKSKESVHCPCCGQKYHLGNTKSKHHIFPKHWFGETGEWFYLCRHCHNELDNSGHWINKNVKGTKAYYQSILNAFIAFKRKECRYGISA